MAKRHLPIILEKQEETALLKSFNLRYPTCWRNKLMIETALMSGMRISELTSLTWSDLIFVEGGYRVHIKEAKGKKDRIVWLSQSLISEIQEYSIKYKGEQSGLIFSNRQGGEIDHGYLRRMIAQRAHKAGIDQRVSVEGLVKRRVHFHLLRHTALTNLYQKTKDLRMVQEVAGHSDPRTTTLYSQISGADIRQAMIG